MSLTDDEVDPCKLSTKQLVSQLADVENQLLALYGENDEPHDPMNRTCDTDELTAHAATVLLNNQHVSPDDLDRLVEDNRMNTTRSSEHLGHSTTSDLHQDESPLHESLVSRPRFMQRRRENEMIHRSCSMNDIYGNYEAYWYAGRSVSLDCLMSATEHDILHRTQSGEHAQTCGPD